MAREYDSVTQAVMGISDRIIGDFDVREASGTLPITKDRKRLAQLRYSIKTAGGRRRLDYSMQPCADVGMEQSLGILVNVADESSPPQDLSFDARNIHAYNRRDFFIQASKNPVATRLNARYNDETVRLAAILLTSNLTSLRKEIESNAQEHRRRFPIDLGMKEVSQTLYGNTGLVTITYLMDGGPECRICPKELSVESRTKLSNRWIADEIVKTFGHKDWMCRSDNTLAEPEENSPRLVVSFRDGPDAVFGRPGPGASLLHSVPEVVSNHDSLDEAKIFDRILAEYEPLTKKQ